MNRLEMTDNFGSPDHWFSLKWFMPATFGNFSWEYPIFFYLLLLIPLLIILRALWLLGKKQKLVIALPESELTSHWSSYFRFIPPVFFAAMFALIVIALARPQKTNEKVEQWTEGIDIMLAIDISESMQLQDFKPNRLEAAKKVAKDFIEGRFQDRIGLVIFSGEAFSLSPLTTDYELLNTFINDIDFDKIESRGTAIGSALAVATNRMNESESKSKVVILLSDGENTAGNIDPITSAKLASAYNIKIYTIAIGREGKVPVSVGPFGQTRYVENNLDETTLREIARLGNGDFFRASNNQTLEEIFKIIDRYEKAEIKETRFKDTTDYYSVYLRWAVLFFLIWLALKSTFMVNVLQD